MNKIFLFLKFVIFWMNSKVLRLLKYSIWWTVNDITSIKKEYCIVELFDY